MNLPPDCSDLAELLVHGQSSNDGMVSAPVRYRRYFSPAKTVEFSG